MTLAQRLRAAAAAPRLHRAFPSAKTEQNPRGWDTTADEGGSLQCVFCEEWIDDEEFRLPSWQIAAEEDLNYADMIDDDAEPDITWNQPPEWWCKPEQGRERYQHQRGAIRRIWGRREPWPEHPDDYDDTDGQFAWTLDQSSTPPPDGDEGWFAMTYVDLD